MSSSLHETPLLASFRASYRDLVRFLTHRTGSADDARDLAQDTWLRLAEQPHGAIGLKQPEESRAYVFTVARNLAIDHLRRHSMVRRHAESGPLQAQHGPDEAEGLMYRQAVTAIEATLDGLPERARQVFLRNKLHGDDQQALAEAFGVSRNTIERDMMLAMGHVETALERWHGGVSRPDAPPKQRVLSGRRRSLSALLGVAGLGVGSAIGWRWWRESVPQWSASLSTKRAETLRQGLPDGTTLTLDADSRLAVQLFDARRHVQLVAGAAFFEVAHDVTRPFVVETTRSSGGTLRVTVLGTRFGVDRGGDGSVAVQVESGQVRVDVLDESGRPLASKVLAGGESLDVAAGRAAELRPGDRPRAASPWREGRLVFEGARLTDAVERLRRYLPRSVVVASDAADLRLTGQVRLAQAEDFLQALPHALPVQATLSADGSRWEIRRR